MINEFINKLSQEKLDNLLVTNIYAKDSLQWSNIQKYLKYYKTNKPGLILVGEAPGYNGCGVSGIPFTSTDVIKNSMFFKRIGIKCGGLVQKESTATIVWEYLDKFEEYPMF